ncbi:hypothetical protein DDZ13_08245 [Coraliomargarita sinensis]|uniref:Gfo/Idh/MocA family oxidoreductase n=1 Tax=Coraliomargarita sinensis TaxID=2174842 RepID=A0A317ZEX5_9BACT|nr:Gfo/Idh/MocA family oxidoreductase [Coraliomargarita sinensis]PXA04025.1 hypothetical protein DDZ13_08245 [Coraliomargarita sinensis]
MSILPRRQFLKTGAVALGVAPLILNRSFAGSVNDEVHLGCIGVGQRGGVNLKNFLNTKGVRVVAVCDVDAKFAAEKKAWVDEFYGNKDCKIFERHEDLLALNGLDAVCLSTPDHWHAKIGIDAAHAGLDIYGEKPFAWGLVEGRKLADAVKQNGCVWQTGCWQRSTGPFRRFKALIERGVLGKMHRYECGTPGGWGERFLPPEDEWAERIGKPPASLDWERYCGPAGRQTYHPVLHPWNWRWTNVFGGGQLLDWVGHHVDIAMWTLGLDHTGPVKVEGSGVKAPHPVYDVYTEYQYDGTFVDGRVFEVRSDFWGAKFTGENGWMHVNRNGLFAASDPDAKEGDRRHPMLRELPEDFQNRVPSHFEDFINCVRTRETTVAPAEAGHRAASFGQLAIAAIDAGRALHWDPGAEKVIGDDELAKHPRLDSRL